MKGEECPGLKMKAWALGLLACRTSLTLPKTLNFCTIVLVNLTFGK